MERAYHDRMARIFWAIRSIWHRPAMFSCGHNQYSKSRYSRRWNRLYRWNIGCSGGGSRRSQFCEWLENVARHHEYGWEEVD